MNNIKALLLISVTLFFSVCLTAQAGEWIWASGAGGSLGDQGIAISIDAQGNKYIAGNFQSASITFGETTLSNQGGTDIYIAKIDSNGDFLWARRAGSWYSDEVIAIELDSAGNLYLTGKFYAETNIGGIPLSSPGFDVDIFVAKLSENGTWLWAKRGGGTGEDVAGDIAVDSSGNVYITGYYRGSASFGTTLSANGNFTEIYVAKLDTNGNWLWAKRAGGTSHDKGNSIEVSGPGNVYVSGYFSLMADFGSTVLSSSGSNDIFIAKLDTNGVWSWAIRAGGESNEFVHDSRLDDNENLYLGGYFTGTASFGLTSLTSSGSADIYAAKIDTGGNWLWAVQAGGPGLDILNGLALSGDNVFVTGSFTDTASFGASSLSSFSESDVFLAKLNGSSWIWAQQAGGSSSESGLGIAIDSSGNIHSTGYFSGLATFGDVSLTSNGSTDVFLASFGNGSAAAMPLMPTNLITSVSGDDILLNWDAVVMDTNGSATTIDHYRVYHHAGDPQGSFSFIAQTQTNTWTHIGAALFTQGFYFATAVVLE